MSTKNAMRTKKLVAISQCNRRTKYRLHTLRFRISCKGGLRDLEGGRGIREVEKLHINVQSTTPGLEAQWDVHDDRPKKKVYPRALVDIMGASGNDKAKLGMNMFKSKKQENLDEQLWKVLLRVGQNMIIWLGNTYLTPDGKDMLLAAFRAI